MPEYRYLSKAKGETIGKGTIGCIDWDARSWGDGGATSLTWEGNSRAMCHVVIGLSARPDWIRVARYQKQSDGSFKSINGMGPAVDLPDMGNAIYSMDTHGNVGPKDLLRVEIKAPADKSISVSAGSGVFSAFYWVI